MRRVFVLIAGLGVLFIALAVSVGLALKSGAGRQLVMSQIDGRTLDSLGVLSASGLSGDVTHAFTLDELQLSDEDGPILTLEGLSLRWRPGGVWRGVLQLDQIQVQSLIVHRMPGAHTQTPPAQSQAGLPLAIQVDALEIASLSVMTAPEDLHALSVSASGVYARDTLQADARLVTRNGETARFDLDWREDQIQLAARGDLTLQGQPYGLVADLNGDLTSGTGAIGLTRDTVDLIQGEVIWDARALTAHAIVPRNALAHIPAPVPEFLHGSDLVLDLSVTRPHADQTGVYTAALQSGPIRLESTGRLTPEQIEGGFALSGLDLDPLTVHQITGRFDYRRDTPLQVSLPLSPDMLTLHDPQLAEAWARLETGGVTLALSPQTGVSADARLTTGFGALTLTGHATPQGVFAADLHSPALSLTPDTPDGPVLSGTHLRLVGGPDDALMFTLTAVGLSAAELTSLCGTEPTPVQIRGQMQGDQLQLEELRLAGACDMVASARMNTTALSLDADVLVGQGAAPGGVQLRAPLSGRLEARFDDDVLNARTEWRSADLFLSDALSGPSRLRVELTGPVSNLRGDADWSLGQDENRLNAQAQFGLSETALSLTSATLQAQGWRADLTGEWASEQLTTHIIATGPDDLRLQVTAGGGLNALALVGDFEALTPTPVRLDLSGRLTLGETNTLALDLNGEAARQPLNAQAQLSTTPSGLEGQVDLRSGALFLSTQLEQIEDRLSVNSQLTGPEIDGVADIAVNTADQSLSGALRLHADLAALARPVTPNASGDLVADLTLSGQTGAPHIAGAVDLTALALDLPDLGVNVQNGQLQARLARGEGWSVAADVEDGRRGRLSAEGGFASDLSEGALTLTYEDFQLIDTPETALRASGALDLNRTSDGWVIGGDSVIEEALIQPAGAQGPSFAEIDYVDPEAEPTPQPGWRRTPIRLDHRIRADRSVTVSGARFTSVWSADIAANGLIAAPQLTGDAVLNSGAFQFLGRPLEFSEGRISFTGDPQQARIEATALRRMENITATVSVSGPVSAPDISLSSNPTLPQDEILARLVFDRGVGQLSPLEIAQLTSLLSEAAGGPVWSPFSALNSVVSLDRFSVTTNSEGRTVLTLGQRITDELSVDVEASGAFNATRIRWSLTPNLSLLSRLTGDADASIALLWGVEFDALPLDRETDED